MEDKNYPALFPERLKHLRKARKISQASLAQKFNISQSAVAGWEKRGKEPPIEMLCRLSDLFGCSTDYLLGRTDNPLSVIPTDTPYEQVTPFEKEFIRRYRDLTPVEQAMICRQLGLEHPAEARLRAKKA